MKDFFSPAPDISLQAPPVLYYIREYREQTQLPIMVLSDGRYMLQVDFRGPLPRFGFCIDLQTGVFIDQDVPPPLSQYHIATAHGTQAVLDLAPRVGINLWARWRLVPQRTDALLLLQHTYGTYARWFPFDQYHFLAGYTYQRQAICLHWDDQGVVTPDIANLAYREVYFAQLLLPYAIYGKTIECSDTTFTFRQIREGKDGNLHLL